jgi:hypothetical protein
MRSGLPSRVAAGCTGADAYCPDWQGRVLASGIPQLVIEAGARDDWRHGRHLDAFGESNSASDLFAYLDIALGRRVVEAT